MTDYAVLIPTKGRPEKLSRVFRTCPTLNSTNTFVGMEKLDIPAYAEWRETLGHKCQIVPVVNPDGMVSVAREHLRQAVVGNKKYKRFLLSDDNCFFTPLSMEILLHAQTISKGVLAGAHSTAEVWSAEDISRGDKYSYEGHEFVIYNKIGMIMWVIPSFLMDAYKYPPDICIEDSHFALHCIFNLGFMNFKSCFGAEFNKTRMNKGGVGTMEERMSKYSKGINRITHDFLQYANPSWFRTNIQWKKILKQGAMK